MKEKLTLLYAEDEALIRSSYIRYLKDKYDFITYEASDGLEALEIYKKHKPNIVLTDITMPNMDGLELVSKIREISYDAKIIILTAHNEQDKLMKALDLYVVNYLIKPINRKKLCEVIDIAINTLTLSTDPLELIHLDEYTQWNSSSCELHFKNEEVKLTKSESLLLEILCQNKNKKIDSTDIFCHVWSDNLDKEFNPSSVRTLVKKLRSKIPQDLIENMYGGFYRLNIM